MADRCTVTASASVSSAELADDLGRFLDAVRQKLMVFRKWRRLRMARRDLLAISAQDARHN